MSCPTRTSNTGCQVNENILLDQKEKNKKIFFSLSFILRWFHNDIELKTSQENLDLKYRITSSNSLLLLHTSKFDNGKYRCMITNEAGQDTIDLHLDINGRHSSNSFFLVITLFSLLSLSLSFIFTFTYFLNMTNNNHIFSSVFFFFLLIFYDVDLFSCLTFFLFFKLVPPLVTVETNEVIGIVNKPITLNCQADGYPFPNIYWTKSGHSIDTQPGKLIKNKVHVIIYLLCKLLLFLRVYRKKKRIYFFTRDFPDNHKLLYARKKK